MKTTVGVWHTFFTAKGIQSFLSDSERFQFAWMESRNPVQRIAGSPVDILVTGIEIDLSLVTFVREMQCAEHPPMMVVMAASMIAPQEAWYLNRFGVKGFVRNPKSENDARIFSTALEAVREKRTFFDPFVIDVYRLDDTEASIKMTDRELEIAILLSHGRCAKEIASRLFLAEKTVEKHRSNLMEKLNIHSTVELCRYMMSRPQIQRPVEEATS
jgi:DNA-binding NarL/FixJ family response regulator